MNKQFNRQETEELLKGLAGDDIEVSIENIDKFLQQQGVLVKIHIGRARNYIEVNPKIFGVDVDKSEELNEFFSEYIKNGTMNFIPNSDEKVLHNIEAKVRTKRDRMAIGYDNEYMPLEIYKEFKDYVDKAREEYLEVRDSILDRWNDLIARFKGVLRASLSDMNALNKEAIYEQIIGKLPTKEDYKNSFYMRIGLRAFPVSQNLNLFDDEISSQIKETLLQDSVRSVHEILGNTLADCFTSVNAILISYDKSNKIAHKTMAGLKEGAKRIRQKNLFKNPFIESIAKDMESMTKLSSDDEVVEKAEIVVCKIYGYSQEINITTLPLNKSAIDQEDMITIYKSIKADEAEEAEF